MRAALRATAGLLAAFAAVLPRAAGSAGSPHDEPAAVRRHPRGGSEAPLACEVEVRAVGGWPRHVFRATRTNALGFTAHATGRGKETDRIELRVYTPQGFLYQTLEVHEPPGRNKRGRALTARLPVAGSSIMASGLYGRWRVVPHLAGRRDPCGPARWFVIRP